MRLLLPGLVAGLGSALQAAPRGGPRVTVGGGGGAGGGGATFEARPPSAEAPPPVTEEDLSSMGDLYVEQMPYSVRSKPAPFWVLGVQNFGAQGLTIFQQLAERVGIVERDPLRPPACLGLTLSNEGVAARERKRVASGFGVETGGAARLLYDVGCKVLDESFEGRPIARFWFLETVARMPYFSYLSMLHLYESLGWWRAPELRKVHAAEEWNELHHLLIMEALGGDELWSDRFLGGHVAIAYYWALNGLFLFSPKAAYGFMELLEAHAVDTYGQFVEENRDRLAALPPPTVARSYYSADDPYLFDDFQVDREPGTRRPPCDSLFDVFTNICIDEAEHVKTMQACQDYAQLGTKVISPHTQYLANNNALSNSGDASKALEAKRDAWRKWAQSIDGDGHGK